MPRTRIKICGITRESDVQAASAAGADAIGLVFYAGSARAVSIDSAASVVRSLPPFLTVVGLFVDADAALVEQACTLLPISLLQFHGDESERYCGGFGMPYMKALRVAPTTHILPQLDRYPDACALLLDTYRQGSPGGTGETFDWSMIPAHCGRDIVLAGGLNADNIGAAIAGRSLYGVDVSGGVESAPGLKDAGKIQAFVNAVQRSDKDRVDGGRADVVGGDVQ